MRKIEIIWQQILSSALYNKKFNFTQKGLAEEFRYSLSTINYALEIPSKIEGFIPSGAIFGGYSAGKRILLPPPADYSQVYFYLLEKDLDQAKDRFPESNLKFIFYFLFF